MIVLVHPDTTQAVAHDSAVNFYQEHVGGLDDLFIPNPLDAKAATLDYKQKEIIREGEETVKLLRKLLVGDG